MPYMGHPSEYQKAKRGAERKEMISEADKINRYLEARGLPRQSQQTLNFVLTCSESATTREWLGALLLQLRCEAHKKHYGCVPDESTREAMWQLSKQEAAKADLT